MRRLSILKTGTCMAAIRDVRGDFDQMFRAALAGLDVELEVLDVVAHPERLADIGEGGVIITGSPASVTARAPWAEALGDWVRDAVRAERAMLGVCYGHQLLAWALGGEVARNPRGWDLGRRRVSLTEAGRSHPLFATIGDSLDALEVHQDAVTRLPPGAELLATSGGSEVEAFAIGPRALGVQFHPEMDAGIVNLYVDALDDTIQALSAQRGEGPAAVRQTLRAELRDAPEARALLRRFVSHL